MRIPAINTSGAQGRLLGIAALSFIAAAASLAPASRSAAQGVDVNAIFSCEPGGPLGQQSPEQCTASRQAVLNNCTACHTFVPIVKAQKTPEAWDATMAAHRPRVPDVSDADFQQLRDFLVAHFNPENPVPALPPELENLGTDQAF